MIATRTLLCASMTVLALVSSSHAQNNNKKQAPKARNQQVQPQQQAKTPVIAKNLQALDLKKVQSNGTQVSVRSLDASKTNSQSSSNGKKVQNAIIKVGEGLANVERKIIDSAPVQVVGDVAKGAGKITKDALGTVGAVVKDTGKGLVTVGQDLSQGKLGKAAVDTVKTAGRVVVDVARGAGAITKDALGTVGEVVQDVGQGLVNAEQRVENGLKKVGSAVKGLFN